MAQWMSRLRNIAHPIKMEAFAAVGLGASLGQKVEINHSTVRRLTF